MASASFLVVEDETLIRMMLVEMIEELGHRVFAEAGTLEDGIRAARDGAFDAALLDVNLGGRPIFPVADALKERGVPFAFASGYGPIGVPAEFRDRPVLQKPFQQADLEKALLTAIAGKGR